MGHWLSYTVVVYVVEMCFNILYEFVDNRIFQSSPTEFCGL